MMAIPINRQSEPSEKQMAAPLPNLSANKSDTAMKARRATDKDILTWVFIFITLGIF